MWIFKYSKLNAFVSLGRWSPPQLERHQSGVSVTAWWLDPETRGLSRHCCDQRQAQVPVPGQWEEDFIRQVQYVSVSPVMEWFSACHSLTNPDVIVWLCVQFHQGRRICSVPGQQQCFPALLLGPLKPHRPPWRCPSLRTSTAPLPFPPCAAWLLLRNSTRQLSAWCRALTSWGEARSSGPPPQVSAYECDSRQTGDLSQRFLLNVPIFSSQLLVVHLTWLIQRKILWSSRHKYTLLRFDICPDIMAVTNVNQTRISRCRLRWHCPLWHHKEQFSWALSRILCKSWTFLVCLKWVDSLQTSDASCQLQETIGVCHTSRPATGKF